MTLQQETTIDRVASATMPTRYGLFDMHVYADAFGKEQVALTVGDIGGAEGGAVLARLHSECLTGDVFGSHRCDCGEQLAASMLQIQTVGRGVLLYLRQEGRGIGLVNKIRAYALQEQGLDTVDANRALGLPDDSRDYGVAAAILRDLGVHSVALLTNNPLKIAGIEQYGIAVAERVPMLVAPNSVNRPYLETKRTRMGHMV